MRTITATRTPMNRFHRFCPALMFLAETSQ